MLFSAGPKLSKIYKTDSSTEILVVGDVLGCWAAAISDFISAFLLDLKYRFRPTVISLFKSLYIMNHNPMKLNIVIRQNSQKNTPLRLSQISNGNNNSPIQVQGEKIGLKEFITNQNQLNELLKNFLKLNLGQNLPVTVNPDSNDDEKYIRISNQATKQRMKHGSQFKELLDPRDRVLQHDFDFSVEIDTQSIQQNGFLSSTTYKEIIDKIREFLVQTLANILSVSFRGLNDHKLEEKQVKNYAASNIMLNLQSIFTKTIEAVANSKKLSELGCFVNEFEMSLDLHDLKVDLLVKLQNIMKNVLTNQDAFYPQAPITGGSLKMKSVVHQVNRTHDEKNDLIYSNGITISKHLPIKKIHKNGRQKEEVFLREDEDYTGFIMEVINCAINVVQTDQADCRDRVNKEIFDEFNKQLFALSQNQEFKSLVQIATSNYNISEGRSIESESQSMFRTDNQQMMKQKQKQAITNYFQLITQSKIQQLKIVKEKLENNKFCSIINKQREKNLQQLKDYAIGIKIPNYVKQFNRQQMAENQFRVKHSSILRILTKWAQNLERIFNNPQEHIMMRLYPFKDINNNLIPITNESTKQQIVQKLRKEQEEVKDKLRQIKARNIELIGQILTEEKESIPYYVYRFTHTRQVSSKINALLTSLMVQYLSVLIHHLLKAGKFILDKEQNKSFKNINLVVFKVSDLMRARFKCSQSSFITLLKTMYLLDQTKAMKGKFKLVRIKNKLQESANNIMINYMFLGKVQCELQLSIQESKGKEKNYFIFSHFIYELIRGSFGIISQCSIMISQLDPIVANSCDELSYQEKKQQEKYYNKEKTDKPSRQKYYHQRYSPQTPSQQKLHPQKHYQRYYPEILSPKTPKTPKTPRKSANKKHSPHKLTNQKSCQKKDHTVFYCANCKKLIIKQQLKLFQKVQGTSKCMKCLFSQKEIQNRISQQIFELKEQLLLDLSQGQIKRISSYEQVKNKDIRYYLRVNSAGKMQFEIIVYISEELKHFRIKVSPELLEKITNKKRKFEYSQEIEYVCIEKFIKKKKKITDCLLFEIIDNQSATKYLKKLKFKYESFSQQIRYFLENVKSFRVQKNLIKQIKLKSEIISFSDDKQKWNCFNKLLKIYSNQDNKSREQQINKELKYRKYKQLQFEKIKVIIAQNNSIQETNDQMIQFCHNLEQLRIVNNRQMKHVDFLKNITSINIIDLHNNNLQNVDGLRKLKHINELNLSNNRLRNVDALESCTTVERLILTDNRLISVDGLKNIRKIKKLYLNNNKLVNIDVLQHCTTLQFLDLSQNGVKNVNFLKNFKHLKELYLNHNKIQNVEVLQNCTSLERLNLSYNSITNVDALLKCPVIERLDVSQNTHHGDQLLIFSLPVNIERLTANHKQLVFFDFRCMQKLELLITDELNVELYQNLAEKVKLINNQSIRQSCLTASTAVNWLLKQYTQTEQSQLVQSYGASEYGSLYSSQVKSSK